MSLVRDDIHPRLVTDDIHPRLVTDDVHPRLVTDDIHPRLIGTVVLHLHLDLADMESDPVDPHQDRENCGLGEGMPDVHPELDPGHDREDTLDLGAHPQVQAPAGQEDVAGQVHPVLVVVHPPEIDLEEDQLTEE